MTGVRLGIETTRKAVQAIRKGSGLEPRIGVVLGSGLSGLGDRLTDRTVFPYADIPGFAMPTVPGHAGRLILGRLGSETLAILEGRFHIYEGYSASQVAFPIRVLGDLGIRCLIVTSAAGAVSRSLRPGDVMLIRDHINLLGDNPLRGTPVEGGAVFIPMENVYDEKLRKTAAKIARTTGVRARDGVLAAVPGPSYETPAEVRMLSALGADAVCMSAVSEIIMARYLRMRVLGMLMITNRAAGRSGARKDKRRVSSGAAALGHDRVLRQAARHGRRFTDLLQRIAEAVHSEK